MVPFIRINCWDYAHRNKSDLIFNRISPFLGRRSHQKHEKKNKQIPIYPYQHQYISIICCSRMRFFILFNLLPNPNRADRATNRIHFTMWFGMHEFIKLMRRNQFNAFCAFANIFFAEIGKYCGNAWYHLLSVFDLHRWSSWFDGLAIWLLWNGKNICHNSWPNAIDKCSVMLAIITTAEFSAIYRDDMWNFGDEKKKKHTKKMHCSFLFFFK